MAIDRYSFGGLLFRLSHEYDHLMRQLGNNVGLYSGQPRILTTISVNPGCTLSELSSLTGLGLPSLSVSIRNMKKTGLVCDNGVGRNRHLTLTELGEEKANAFHRDFDTFLNSFIDSLGEERSEVLERELSSMHDYIQAYRNQ